ncbi:hypothetical protein JZ751_029347 [Albula glossodonta]|uniref:Neuropilin C-terminal domain-containing protein n=1 Tax=Albula glossodonta TaxID=121402 RepID=A0A8T2P9W9_9TELE|nr:hypothetical protein JZ751_029347 [Albula glossodonta]
MTAFSPPAQCPPKPERKRESKKFNATANWSAQLHSLVWEIDKREGDSRNRRHRFINVEFTSHQGSSEKLFKECTPGPSADPPVTRVSEKDNSWLYTLDPILVTIIVMSSLGVLLGAVCAGLLLYCTCSYNGISSRSSTTLENYNFELYDGIKHKVKINQQRCCSEA